MKTHLIFPLIFKFLNGQSFNLTDSCINEIYVPGTDSGVISLSSGCGFKLETDWYSNIGLIINPNGSTLPDNAEITISDELQEKTFTESNQFVKFVSTSNILKMTVNFETGNFSNFEFLFQKIEPEKINECSQNSIQTGNRQMLQVQQWR